jgi:DNA-binding IclR family transcriptional regulator
MSLEGDLRRSLILVAVSKRPMTVREVAELVDLSPATAHYHLKRMKDAGLIEHIAGYRTVTT